MFSNIVIRLNNLINRFRSLKAKPENILLLVPHCLQITSCGRNVIHDINQCAHCGQCNITELIAIRDKYHVQCNIASGGRQALAMVRDPRVHLVLAVACNRELSEGILAAWPKPVVAVPNTQPEGPCRNTRVDIQQLEASLKKILI